MTYLTEDELADRLRDLWDGIDPVTDEVWAQAYAAIRTRISAAVACSAVHRCQPGDAHPDPTSPRTAVAPVAAVRATTSGGGVSATTALPPDHQPAPGRGVAPSGRDRPAGRGSGTPRVTPRPAGPVRRLGRRIRRALTFRSIGVGLGWVLVGAVGLACALVIAGFLTSAVAWLVLRIFFT